MDALLTINAGTQMADAIIPTKEPQQHEKNFSKELHRKRNEHQPEKKVTAKHSESARQVEHKQNVVGQQTTGSKQQPIDQSETESNVVAEVEDIQQGVVTRENQLPQVNVASTEVVEDGDVEVQQVDLVAALEVADQDDSEEEGTDFAVETPIIVHPESPAKAVETPHFVEPAVVTSIENQEENPLPQQAVPGVVAAVEPQQVVVATQNQEKMKTSPQQTVPVVVTVESSQAVVATQNQEESNPLQQTVVAVPVAEVKEVLSQEQRVARVVADEAVETVKGDGETIDPRFSALLKPRAEKQEIPPLRDAASLHGSKVTVQQQPETVTASAIEEIEVKHDVEPVQLGGLSAKHTLDQLAQSGQHLQGQGQVHAQGVAVAKGMPQAPMVQLSNGYQIPESQIFDQVVTQISGSVNGESGRMILRLQPAELGSLRLELKIEGDRVQAHLHTQTHQVQEVLQRNLPQLRSALAEQGLKIDQFLVNVDQRQAEGQFDGQTQYQQPGTGGQSDWYQDDHEPEEQMIPLAHLMQNGGGGISLHV